MASTELPVAVVGNGPVGLTAALLLAQWEIPVVILDARPRRDEVGSKAICQQRDVLDIWSHVGAADQIVDEGVTWSTARTFYRDQELFSTTFADAGRSPFPPFVNISQTRTEAVLEARADAEDGIQVRWGHEVTGVENSDHGVTLEGDGRNGRFRIEASHAIVCSGARSDQLREHLGLGFGGETFGDRFLICDIRVDLPEWSNERRFYFDPSWNPGRQILIHPCPDSVFRIDWQVPENYDIDDDESSGALAERIEKIVGNREYEVVWKSDYRFHSRVVDRMQIGRIVVAGDAAHLVAPFGARGLNSGVQDAENAAWKIAFVRRGWASDRLLESYQSERIAAALENLDVTGETMRFLVPQNEVERAHRQQTLDAAQGDLTARSLVDSGRLAEPYWYCDSPLTTKCASRPNPGRPAKGQPQVPGPGVIVPDFPVAGGRLRQLLRSGVTLLLGDEVDDEAVSIALRGVAAPVRWYRLSMLAPGLQQALGSRPDELWLVRPDAHVAAVLERPDSRSIRGALDRALAKAPERDPANAFSN